MNRSQSSSIAAAQCPAEFHSVPITALLALPSLWPLIVKSFLLQWPNSSCFLCLPTKYPPSIHSSLSNSQTSSWARGTHRSVAFHTAFSLTELQILKGSTSGQDSTSFWPMISSANLYKLILKKKKISSTLFIWQKLEGKIKGCLWCVWTAELGNFEKQLWVCFILLYLNFTTVTGNEFLLMKNVISVVVVLS